MTPPMTPREKVIDVIRNRIEADENAKCGGTVFDDAEQTKYVYVDIGEFDLGAVADDVLTALASGSGDHAELARLAQTAIDAAALGDGLPEVALARFQAAANPSTVLALLAENAALRAEKDRVGRTLMTMQEAIPSAYHPNGSGLRLFIADLRDQATEAERKLAEAVELLGDVVFVRKDHSGQSSDQMLDAIIAKARTFISKEAERG